MFLRAWQDPYRHLLKITHRERPGGPDARSAGRTSGRHPGPGQHRRATRAEGCPDLETSYSRTFAPPPLPPAVLLTALTRLLDEEEVVESLVRHHAAFVHWHISLDNGSSDRSLEILAALQREGFVLRVYRNTSPVFAEPIYNTALVDLAVAEGAADWMVFLDCDEFIDDRGTEAGLCLALAGVPAGVASRPGAAGHVCRSDGGERWGGEQHGAAGASAGGRGDDLQGDRSSAG